MSLIMNINKLFFACAPLCPPPPSQDPRSAPDKYTQWSTGSHHYTYKSKGTNYFLLCVVHIQWSTGSHHYTYKSKGTNYFLLCVVHIHEEIKHTLN